MKIVYNMLLTLSLLRPQTARVRRFLVTGVLKYTEMQTLKPISNTY